MVMLIGFITEVIYYKDSIYVMNSKVSHGYIENIRFLILYI